MATRLARFESGLSELRYFPTAKHVRAVIDGTTVVDSRRAVLLWEPHRVVPQYAVPIADVAADLVPGRPGDGDTRGGPVRMGDGAIEVLTPEAGFGHHTAEGDVLTVRTSHQERVGAAFRLADPDLADHVVLDWDAFDEWFEEAQRVIGHPTTRWPASTSCAATVTCASSATGRCSRRAPGRACSSRPACRSGSTCRPRTCASTCSPERHPDDVRLQGRRVLLGRARRRRPPTDVAWTYPDPSPDAVPVTDMVCFFDERVDIVVDGERRDRPLTPGADRPGEQHDATAVSLTRVSEQRQEQGR